MQTQSVSINFKGGIVSPGYLKEILEVARECMVTDVRFGLRQQMIVEVPTRHWDRWVISCQQKNVDVCKSRETHPNIMSSYPAAGIFHGDSWLREGVYKDIFDLFHHKPALKINICDSQQCFVPFFTGHINWVSSSAEHFWHLYIRFPKTTRLFHWKDLVYTNDLAVLSRKIEQEILQDRFIFYANENADIDILYRRVQSLTAYVARPAITEPLIDFSLPYYEGFNKTNNQLWLGIYRRNEQFPVEFLLDICHICLRTRIGQLYTTPWKGIVVKNIDPATRKLWDQTLGKYRINVRHAANELNWQVEDFSEEGLQLKRYIIRHFDKEDVRTYGLCFAVQTRPASGMFGTIVIQKQQTKNPNRLRSLERYDILFKKNFNPNERELISFRKGVEKEHISTYLVSLCKLYYAAEKQEDILYEESQPAAATEPGRMIYQCTSCFTVYDPMVGDEVQGIQPGTGFQQLPEEYCCPVCSGGQSDFIEVPESVIAIVR